MNNYMKIYTILIIAQIVSMCSNDAIARSSGMMHGGHIGGMKYALHSGSAHVKTRIGYRINKNGVLTYTD